MKVRADFVHPIPDSISDSEAAPLLCAGAVGYRALKLCNLQNGQTLGLMGFGGSNHLVLKVARHKYPKSNIFVFSRNSNEREFALSLGAAWAGAIDANPPEGMDAVIDTTPVWAPISEAMKRLKPGGRLVINAIRRGSRQVGPSETGLPLSIVDGEGNQIGGQRDPGGCARIPAARSRREHQARIPGVRPGAEPTRLCLR